jgi:hypothetical protein
MKDAQGNEINLGDIVQYGSISQPKTGRVIELTTKFKRKWIGGGGFSESPWTTVKVEVKTPNSYSGYTYRVRLKPANVLVKVKA